MTEFRSTYYRADGDYFENGNKIISIADNDVAQDPTEDFLNDYILGFPYESAFDIIEEYYNGNTLVKFRTLHLGASEPCARCKGRGVVTSVTPNGPDTPFGSCKRKCPDCLVQYFTLLDPNPAWTV
jgi:hypothetical protein